MQPSVSASLSAGFRARFAACAACAVVLAGAWAPMFAAAQTMQAPPADTGTGNWRYSLSVYGYLPNINGTTSAASPGGPPIEVSVGEIVDRLKFTFMGSLDIHNGRWGAFTDVIYLNLGETRYGTRAFTIDGAAPPANATADLGWDLRGTLWTVAGEYRIVSTPSWKTDVLAGARMFDLRQTTSWGISGDLGSTGVARSGSVQNSETLWDGVVGVKGRYALGATSRWSMPFYVDVGTGESRLTWQAAGGISYAYSWGELSAMWRYLSYDMKSGSAVRDLSFNGPMLGATFRW